jgi:PurA ssDNA and RNA-binding protein
MNDYRSPYSGYSSSKVYQGPGGLGQHKPPVAEDTIRTEKIQIERKTFVIALKENPRGRFLRITEDVGGRRDTIIIPSTGLADFKRVIDEMVRTSDETPLKSPPPPPSPLQ